MVVGLVRVSKGLDRGTGLGYTIRKLLLSREKVDGLSASVAKS
jgi:hypothetical protein